MNCPVFRSRNAGKALVCILALVAMLCLLTACGSTPTKRPTASTQQTQAASTPETVSEQTMIRLLEEVFALPEDVITAAETSDSAKMLCLINEKTHCSIGAIHADSVELSITAPDMKAIFAEQLDTQTAITDPAAESERMMAAVLARLQSDDCPMVTNAVTAAIQQGEAGAEIAMAEDLADAMYGNLLTLFDALYAQIGG